MATSLGALPRTMVSRTIRACGLLGVLYPLPSMAAQQQTWPLRFVKSDEVYTGRVSAPVGLGVARLHGEGPDLVVADAVRGLILLRNAGSGRFQEEETLAAGSSATCVGVGDWAEVTGLGISRAPTLAAANMLDTFVTVFAPDPKAGGRYHREDIPTATSPQSVTMVALPGEPTSALLVGRSSNRQGRIDLLRRTDRGWVTRSGVELPWQPMNLVPYPPAPGVSRELFASPTSGRAVAALEFEPGGGLALRQILPASHPILASAISAGGDLLVGVGGPRATVWSRPAGSLPGAPFAKLTELAAPHPLTGVAVADLNGDGAPEIVATSTDEVLVWSGIPSGGFAAPRVIAPAHRGFAPVIADFNHDGRLDIAYNNSIWRSVIVLRNETPTGIPGDVDGNGQVDAADVRLVLRAITGPTILSPPERAAADVRPIQPDGAWGDGRVTVEDAVAILESVGG